MLFSCGWQPPDALLKMTEYRIFATTTCTCIGTLAATHQVQSIALLLSVLVIGESALISLLHTVLNNANLDRRDCSCIDFVLIFGWPAETAILLVCSSNSSQFLNLVGNSMRGCILFLPVVKEQGLSGVFHKFLLRLFSDQLGLSPVNLCWFGLQKSQ